MAIDLLLNAFSLDLSGSEVYFPHRRRQELPFFLDPLEGTEINKGFGSGIFTKLPPGEVSSKL
jgi:hypothetical protein